MPQVPGSFACRLVRSTAPETRYPIAPIGNLRAAIVKHKPVIVKVAQLFSMLQPMIAKHRPVIVKVAQLFDKVAQLFSVLHPLIVKHRPVIAKVAQLFSNFTLRFSFWQVTAVLSSWVCHSRHLESYNVFIGDL